MGIIGSSLGAAVGFLRSSPPSRWLTLAGRLGEVRFWSFYALVAGVYYLLETPAEKLSWKDVGDQLLPRTMRDKRSFSVDIQWFLIARAGYADAAFNTLSAIFLLRETPKLFAYLKIDQSWLGRSLQDLLSQHGQFRTAAVFAIALLAYDFGQYITHRLFHESTFLWQFHKVHHYPRQLTYIAAGRTHPVDRFITCGFSYFLMACAISLLTPIDARLFVGPGSYANMSSWFYIGLIVLPGFVNRLNHSHFPIHFGEFMSKVFVSPANHFVHHSRVIMDMNFGAFFSFWDVWFGTYYPVIDRVEAKAHLQTLGVKNMADDAYGDVLKWLWQPCLDGLSVLRSEYRPNPALPEELVAE